MVRTAALGTKMELITLVVIRSSNARLSEDKTGPTQTLILPPLLPIPQLFPHCHTVRRISGRNFPLLDPVYRLQQ